MQRGARLTVRDQIPRSVSVNDFQQQGIRLIVRVQKPEGVGERLPDN